MAQIKKISDGKYLVRVSKGTRSNRRYINATIRGTRKGAERYAREQETMLDTANPAFDPGLTYAKFFEKWLAAIAPKLAPRTLDGYDGSIRRYALATIGSIKISSVRAFHIQEIYSTTRKSPTTIRNLHAALRASFTWAVRMGLISSNPCKNVDVPARQRTEIVVFSLDEAATFVDICRTMPSGLIFEFALETGMRPEEYLALRWRDITGSECFLQQAVQFNRKGGGYYFKELKTARSRRRVPLSDGLKQQIVRHRIAQNEHRLAMKGTWFNHDLVFPNAVGRPIEIANLTRRFLAPIFDKCRFDRHLTLYSLRHSCATLLLMLGENPKTVADRLGHSSVSMTLDIYSHVLPHIQDGATEKLAKALNNR